MKQTTDPTMSEVIADLVSGTATVDSSAVQRTISARINVYTLARVDSFANSAKKSRNEMINLLLQAACESVNVHLPDDVADKLKAHEHASYQAFLSNEE